MKSINSLGNNKIVLPTGTHTLRQDRHISIFPYEGCCGSVKYGISNCICYSDSIRVIKFLNSRSICSGLSINPQCVGYEGLHQHHLVVETGWCTAEEALTARCYEQIKCFTSGLTRDLKCDY